jgi:uncharacterized protein YqeY
MTEAMRARDELRRDTLRMAIAALYNAEKAARRPLTNDESLAVLSREIKTRSESVEAYTRGGRVDLAAKEEREIGILSEFLPPQLGSEELDAMVEAAVAEVGATSPRDLGRVMKVLSPQIRGRADGRVVSERVQRRLGSVAPDGPGGGV